MTAYVISEVQIVEPEGGEEYRELAAASIAAHGGEYLVRAAQPDVADGEWPAERRMVIARFPTMAVARAWYDSPGYARPRELAVTALRRRLLFVDGVDGVDEAPAG